MMEKNTDTVIPFMFQKGIKADACEDAPPIATTQYAIVCDGLGGSGYTKHIVPEDTAKRTSAYLGSRIVSECVEKFYQEHGEELNTSDQETLKIGKSVEILKENLVTAIQSNVDALHITLPRGNTTKIFPTTLASTYYFPCEDKLTVVAIWAGDSRVYVLTPSKGLQLLSLDDADGAADSMNSGTVMTNCIYAGDFHINYCVYTLEDPGIVFCCSDGCFDYLRSPLHMEWLLLTALLSVSSESDGDLLGKALAESISDGVYPSIKDDTTMAGICFRFHSTASLHEAFQPRMDAFDPMAIQMNEYIKEKNAAQNARDEAKKTYHLNESKVTDTIQKVVCEAISASESGSLGESLKKLAAFSEYEQMEAKELQQLETEFVAKEKELKHVITACKKRCRNLFMSDYMGQDIQQNRSGRLWGKAQGWGSKPSSTGESGFSSQAFDTVVATLIEMVKREEFSSFSSPLDEGIQNGMLSVLARMRDNLHQGSQDKKFYAFMKQAYYSSDLFSAQRTTLEGNPQFQDAWERLLEDPKSCPYCSWMTSEAVQEVRNAIADYDRNAAQVEEKARERSRELAIQYYKRKKEQIQKELFGKSTQELQELFQDSGIAMGQLIEVADAWKSLYQDGKANQVEEVGSRIQGLWTEYRKEYQLFNQVERGRT